MAFWLDRGLRGFQRTAGLNGKRYGKSISGISARKPVEDLISPLHDRHVLESHGLRFQVTNQLSLPQLSTCLRMWLTLRQRVTAALCRVAAPVEFMADQATHAAATRSSLGNRAILSCQACAQLPNLAYKLPCLDDIAALLQIALGIVIVAYCSSEDSQEHRTS